eukprot:CAMPEP_0172320960 /NCGR_PEP_ID=MMETSP1058-20130122/41877_1 /TAXON_ID=83371 /ORGANISM="Detonula confervacea, Strain CCMP 353" /LENGTH=505 /DNA_ID=CAMNT_0013036329 /DNA_START=14 /DNA_END=1531 /DNA_ORIENTATION=-
MALDSSDLQQRRPAATSKRPTKERTASSSGVTSIRRRRRKSDPNRAAFIATLLFAAIAIPLVFVTSRLLGKGSANKGDDVDSNNRFLQDWKPKTAITDAEERAAKQREERYQSLYRPKFDESTLGYDIYNCPHTPPKDYPKAWKTTEVLGAWKPTDVTTLPPGRDVYQGLCVFDHQTQYTTALNYRNAEKPFIIRNDPKVTSVARRWENNPEYLHRVLGDVEEFRTERSPNNHFMWYRLRGKHASPKGYIKPENDEIEMTFGEYLEHAIEKDGKALGDEDMIAKSSELKERRLSLLNNKKEEHEDDDSDDGEVKKDEDSEEAKQEKYYYFRINADLRKAEKDPTSKFIYDELTFFDPRKEEASQFYMVDPDAQRGINCRFGMRGVIAANHFDMSRNMVAVLGGERRYVLASPTQCKKMALHPQGHPSVRHSSLDWTNPTEWHDHPEFKDALITEVVLHAGDVLYLPTNWFHYIINLSLNYQCNARSGTSHETSHFMQDCGFKMPS